jgi:hypothetical protein
MVILPSASGEQLRWDGSGHCAPACAEFPKMQARIAELQNSYLARAAHNAFVILADAKAEKLG